MTGIKNVHITDVPNLTTNDDTPIVSDDDDDMVSPNDPSFASSYLYSLNQVDMEHESETPLHKPRYGKSSYGFKDPLDPMHSRSFFSKRPTPLLIGGSKDHHTGLSLWRQPLQLRMDSSRGLRIKCTENYFITTDWVMNKKKLIGRYKDDMGLLGADRSKFRVSVMGPSKYRPDLSTHMNHALGFLGAHEKPTTYVGNCPFDTPGVYHVKNGRGKGGPYVYYDESVSPEEMGAHIDGLRNIYDNEESGIHRVRYNDLNINLYARECSFRLIYDPGNDVKVPRRAVRIPVYYRPLKPEEGLHPNAYDHYQKEWNRNHKYTASMGIKDIERRMAEDALNRELEEIGMSEQEVIEREVERILTRNKRVREWEEMRDSHGDLRFAPRSFIKTSNDLSYDHEKLISEGWRGFPLYVDERILPLVAWKYKGYEIGGGKNALSVSLGSKRIYACINEQDVWNGKIFEGYSEGLRPEKDRDATKGINDLEGLWIRVIEENMVTQCDKYPNGWKPELVSMVRPLPILIRDLDAHMFPDYYNKFKHTNGVRIF